MENTNNTGNYSKPYINEDIRPLENTNTGQYAKPFINENIPAPAEDHPHSSMLSVIAEVRAERIKQDKKWGVQNHHPFKWVAILGEEFGEVSKATLEQDIANYREELIQVAAVAIAALENLDRVTVTINVDGKNHIVEKDEEISYGKIIKLSKNDKWNTDYSIVFEKGPLEKPEGFLIPNGNKIKPVEGMRFYVAVTGAA